MFCNEGEDNESINPEYFQFDKSYSQLDELEGQNYEKPSFDFTNFESRDIQEQTKIETRNTIIKFITTKSNKGRKRKRDEDAETGNIEHNGHTKFSSDNIKTKVQCHFFSFLRQFVNFFLILFGYTEQFFDIDYNDKINSNKKTFPLLKETPIGDILSKNISRKLKTQPNKQINLIIYQKVINNPIINNLLSEKYITLFKEIYYKSNPIINLKRYGLDYEFKLSPKIPMFDSLKKTINKQTKQEDYIQEIIKFIEKNYLNEGKNEKNGHINLVLSK